MLRVRLSLFIPLVLLIVAGFCKVNAVEIIDPAEAKKDPDFLIQGEYLGEAVKDSGETFKAGAQVIALGKGEFSIVIFKGGLPGDGWKRGEDIISELKGKTIGKEVQISGKEKEIEIKGKVIDETMILTAATGKAKLKRIKRKSSTLKAKPPAGAEVLFDGTTADNFKDGTLAEDKTLMSNATSKQKFGDYRLHLEFRLSYMPDARGQGRSNSGVYVHDCYEIQVLDSFGLEGKNDDCGGFYSIRRPDVNMCFPPLVWQTYDIEFTAPKYENGKKVANARITVKQNGVTIHDNAELPHATPGRQEEGPAPRPFYLQGHGNKVEYRNIWVVEKK